MKRDGFPLEAVEHLRALWRSQKSTLNGWISISDASATEIMAAQNYDSITVDLQHTSIQPDDCFPLFLAAAVQGKPALARVPSNDAAAISKVLDAGALGVICPQINSRVECEAFVAACRYPPRGSRSFGPFSCVARYGPDYPRLANEKIICFAMIESLDGYRNIDSILEVDGLDGIYVGPNDLSLALGYAASQDSTECDVIRAISSIQSKVQGAGLVPGIACPTGAVANKRIREGFQFVTPGNQLNLIVSGAATEILNALGCRSI